MAKRKLGSTATSNTRKKRVVATMATADDTIFFRATETADEANCLTDGVRLATPTSSSSVVLPWMGFGTYKLGQDVAYQAIQDALKLGYRSLDTAFIYGGETTERLVGQAIQSSLQKGILPSRQHLFVTTKHWRKYHGYEPTKQCLSLSLKRLQLEYIDLYLIHWPGPAYQTMNRRKDVIQQQGPWHYAVQEQADMEHIRSETWKAMEEALQQGLVRSIGVSNFSIHHLEALKKTAKVWPPAVNQVEFHPLYPQPELLEYCRKEGIVLQAYASLGGQDTGKKQWNKLDLEPGPPPLDNNGNITPPPPPFQGKKKPQAKKLRDTVVSLLTCRPVVALAHKHHKTPAQILLRWALSQNCVVIPKTTSVQRLVENADALTFALTQDEIHDITTQVQASRAKAATRTDDKLLSEEDRTAIQSVGEQALGRLCWRNDPFRHLDC